MKRCLICLIVACMCCITAQAGAPAATRPAKPPKKVGKVAEYYHELALAHAAYKKTDEAAMCFNKAIELEGDPAKKSIYSTELGGMLVSAGKIDAARKAFFAAIDAADARGRLKLCRDAAETCRKADQLGLAGEILQKAIDLADDPRDKSSARLHFMSWLKKTDQVDDLAAEHLKTLGTKPDDPEALEWMAIYYLMVENSIEKGLVAYQKLLKVRPNDTEVIEELAVLHLANMETDKAVEMYQRIASIDKTKAAHAYEQLATMASINGDTKKAIEWNKKMFAAGGAGPERRLRQAKLHRLLKEYPQAVASLEKALETGEGSGLLLDTIKLELAKMYSYAGRKDDAVKTLNDVLKTSTTDRVKRAARQELTKLTAPK